MAAKDKLSGPDSSTGRAQARAWTGALGAAGVRWQSERALWNRRGVVWMVGRGR